METEMMTSVKLGSKGFNISSLVSVIVQSRGTQFGEVLSTSQVANNFIGTGRWGVEAAETSRRIPPESAMLS